MITITVTGPAKHRRRVADAVQAALVGARFVVRRFGIDVDPSSIEPGYASHDDVNLCEQSTRTAPELAD
jgi:hypothetical protein